jgi:hypothetical protein
MLGNRSSSTMQLGEDGSLLLKYSSADLKSSTVTPAARSRNRNRDRNESSLHAKNNGLRLARNLSSEQSAGPRSISRDTRLNQASFAGSAAIFSMHVTLRLEMQKRSNPRMSQGRTAWTGTAKSMYFACLPPDSKRGQTSRMVLAQ